MMEHLEGRAIGPGAGEGAGGPGAGEGAGGPEAGRGGGGCEAECPRPAGFCLAFPSLALIPFQAYLSPTFVIETSLHSAQLSELMIALFSMLVPGASAHQYSRYVALGSLLMV